MWWQTYKILSAKHDRVLGTRRQRNTFAIWIPTIKLVLKHFFCVCCALGLYFSYVGVINYITSCIGVALGLCFGTLTNATPTQSGIY